MEKYPLVDAHLFLGGSVVGVNPKINNMQPGYEAAKYEYIMISDSGIRSKLIRFFCFKKPMVIFIIFSLLVKEDTLLDMVQHMTEKVGLVHQMPFTCDRDGFAATFEKVYSNCSSNPTKW